MSHKDAKYLRTYHKIFLKTSLETRIFEKMKIYAMFIDEKTLCGSITRSYLQKLGYQCELSFCGLPIM